MKVNNDVLCRDRSVHRVEQMGLRSCGEENLLGKGSRLQYKTLMFQDGEIGNELTPRYYGKSIMFLKFPLRECRTNLQANDKNTASIQK